MRAVARLFGRVAERVGNSEDAAQVAALVSRRAAWTRTAPEESTMATRETAATHAQFIRSQVWLGMTQLGAGQLKDAEAAFSAARSVWRQQASHAARRDGAARLDAQLTEWIARSRGA